MSDEAKPQMGFVAFGPTNTVGCSDGMGTQVVSVQSLMARIKELEEALARASAPQPREGEAFGQVKERIDADTVLVWDYLCQTVNVGDKVYLAPTAKPAQDAPGSPEAEPVAWRTKIHNGWHYIDGPQDPSAVLTLVQLSSLQKLYTAPTALLAEKNMLNDEQIWRIAEQYGLCTELEGKPLWFDADVTEFARAIIAAMNGEQSND